MFAFSPGALLVELLKHALCSVRDAARRLVHRTARMISGKPAVESEQDHAGDELRSSAKSRPTSD